MIKQGIAVLSLWACVWLLAAWEFGAVGVWAVFFIIGVLAVWVGAFAYSNWKWAEEGRRQERKDRRMARRMMEQTNKERYLREVA